MKRFYNILAFIATAITIVACNPLDKTYKRIGDLPSPSQPAVTGTLTLSAADYKTLPKGHGAATSLYFKSIDTAKADIPLILASKYSTYGEKSSINVTYNITPVTIKLADSVFNNVAYTVVNPTDYVAAQAVTGTTYKDYSAAQVLLFLTYKYPNPVANQLSLLTYLYYESGVTPSSGVLTTDSFIYLNGAWVKGYTISAAQYAAAGRGNYGNFISADIPNLPVIFNTFLKNDVSVAATAKVGDVKYVSYKYYASSVAYQRVLPLTFDGTNWTTTPITASLTFAKTNGIWVPDNTVTYTLVKQDYTDISKIPNVGSDAAIANLASFGNFNIQGGATTWTDDQINNGIATLLKTKYPSAETNQKFVITYSAYSGSNIVVTKTFVYNGSAFTVQK